MDLFSTCFLHLFLDHFLGFVLVFSLGFVLGGYLDHKLGSLFLFSTLGAFCDAYSKVIITKAADAMHISTCDEIITGNNNDKTNL